MIRYRVRWKGSAIDNEISKNKNYHVLEKKSRKEHFLYVGTDVTNCKEFSNFASVQIGISNRLVPSTPNSDNEVSRVLVPVRSHEPCDQKRNMKAKSSTCRVARNPFRERNQWWSRNSLYMVYSSWTEPTFWPIFLDFFETLLPLSTTLQDVSHQISDLWLFFSLNYTGMNIFQFWPQRLQSCGNVHKLK